MTTSHSTQTPSPPSLRRVKTLAGLARRIVQCDACPRLTTHRRQVAAEKRRAYRDWTYWGRPVPGFGDPEARVVLIGLAPGAHGANRTGRMFTGDSSGDFLFSALHRCGFASQPTSRSRDDDLELHDCYITNSVRCVPPGNRPTPEERRCCRPFLLRELALLSRACVLLALGQIGYEECLRALADSAGREGDSVRPPRFGHGLQWEHPSGLVICASYHPSRQNTQTGRLTAEMFDAVLVGVRARLAGRPGESQSAGRGRAR